MKKFLASLFILAVFSGVVFYLGWTQFKVKPEQIGVVISKTNGIDKTPVENGKFSWHKQFLLPTNAVLKTFSIKPVNTVKNITGTVPASYGGDLTYNFEFTISLTVAPEVIPDLLKENKISNSEDLQAYLTAAADTIAQLSADYILKKTKENPNFSPESVRRDDLLRNIMIYKEYPEIDLMVFAVTEYKLPDYNYKTDIKLETKNDYKIESRIEESEIFTTEGDEL